MDHLLRSPVPAWIGLNVDLHWVTRRGRDIRPELGFSAVPEQTTKHVYTQTHARARTHTHILMHADTHTHAYVQTNAHTLFFLVLIFSPFSLKVLTSKPRPLGHEEISPFKNPIDFLKIT